LHTKQNKKSTIVPQEHDVIDPPTGTLGDVSFLNFWFWLPCAFLPRYLYLLTTSSKIIGILIPRGGSTQVRIDMRILIMWGIACYARGRGKAIRHAVYLLNFIHSVSWTRPQAVVTIQPLVTRGKLLQPIRITHKDVARCVHGALMMHCRGLFCFHGG
jgi:hypothetical protein